MATAKRRTRSAARNPSKGRAKTHKDVTFELALNTYKRFDEAAGMAVARAASTGRGIYIDVVVLSESGARWYGGDYGVEQYREDPDASVFERIEVRADSKGRIA